MRQSLFPADSTAEAADGRFIRLPGWCCQAAGGDPRETEAVSAAWLLLYASAHLFDSVQDGDAPDEWWRELGSGAALNVACGLLASAWSVLAGIDRPWIDAVRQDFAHTVLQMGSGQHADLTARRLSLEAAWSIARAKSGAFFALACRAGARVAGAPQPSLEQYAEYGLSLGLMVQIADDASDLQAQDGMLQPAAFPLAFAWETASPQDVRLLAQAVKAQYDRGDRRRLRRMLDHNGTSLYLSAKLAQLRTRGIRALEAASAQPPAKEKLSQLLHSLDPYS